MNPDTAKAIGKIVGGVIFIGLGVCGLTHPPLLELGGPVSGGLIAAGASALGFDASAVIAVPAAKVAAMRQGSKQPQQP